MLRALALLGAVSLASFTEDVTGVSPGIVNRRRLATTEAFHCSGGGTCTGRDEFSCGTIGCPERIDYIPGYCCWTLEGSQASVTVNNINHPSVGENGKYFFFDRNDWKAMTGDATVAGTYQVTQTGSNEWTGEVVVWDNRNGVHGRRASGAAAGQWEAGDLIKLNAVELTPAPTPAPTPEPTDAPDAVCPLEDFVETKTAKKARSGEQSFTGTFHIAYDSQDYLCNEKKTSGWAMWCKRAPNGDAQRWWGASNYKCFRDCKTCVVDEGPSELTGPPGPTGPRGADGEQGPQGLTGPRGSDGKQGPRGLTGPRGDDGEPGHRGHDGKTGSVGPRGAEGASGPVGPRGKAGRTGPSGPDGMPGARGDDGKPGPVGPRGEDGLPGPVGPVGEAGPMGPMGQEGQPGRNGADGKLGPRGPMGPVGEQGADGKPGPMGPVGPVGDQGPVGPMGERGPQGERGPSGDDGRAGKPGLPGHDGKPGPQGPEGQPGQNGRDGKTGPTGPAGKRGKTGLQGPQGEDGKRGSTGKRGPEGAEGPQGKPGRDGKNGKTGSKGSKGSTGPRGPTGKTGPSGAKGPKGDTGPQGKRGERGERGKQGAKGSRGPAGPSNMPEINERFDDMSQEIQTLEEELTGFIGGMAKVECGSAWGCKSRTESAGCVDLDTKHEVRCCSDKKLSGSKWHKSSKCSVWGASEVPKCLENKTFQEAERACTKAGARLCTSAELKKGCAQTTGCGHDEALVWSNDYCGGRRRAEAVFDSLEAPAPEN